jgi:hypothetical protein
LIASRQRCAANFTALLSLFISLFILSFLLIPNRSGVNHTPETNGWEIEPSPGNRRRSLVTSLRRRRCGHAPGALGQRRSIPGCRD